MSEPATEPVKEDPKPAPKPADPELKPRPANTYVLKPGDSPSSVARDIYNRVSAATELVRKNKGAGWQPGDIIKLL